MQISANNYNQMMTRSFQKMEKVGAEVSSEGITPENASAMLDSRAMTKVASSVMKVQDEMLGSLLDILA